MHVILVVDDSLRWRSIATAGMGSSLVTRYNRGRELIFHSNWRVIAAMKCR